MSNERGLLAAAPAETTAQRLLRLLSLRGVEVLFANSGTDFTPIIDGLARLEDAPGFALRVVQCPHESTTVVMAHGHALLSRKPQAVMVHVNVGTANIGMGLINARRARVPMLVMAGRTPWYEDGEFTKWDYELKGPHSLEAVVDRALAIAASDPAGPVYLSLPKEPLCETAAPAALSPRARQTPSRPSFPDETSLELAMQWLREARRPLIITADLGRHMGGPEALQSLSERAGIGVIEHGKRNFYNFPTEHPHHLGFDPSPHVRDADLILAVECPVPWSPSSGNPSASTRVIQIGVDPLFSDIPFRGFPSDLSLAGDPAATLRALAERLGRTGEVVIELAQLHERTFGTARETAEQAASAPRITKAHLSRVIGQLVEDDVVLFNEGDLDPLMVPRRRPDSWFENSCANGLGWSLGAALGAKLAAPERTMVVTVGAGSYLFNTPLSAHSVAAAEGLPVLVIVFNDQGWSTEGTSVRKGRFALTDFATPVDYEKVAEACGGIGLRAETPAELPGKLREALELVRTGKRHVLLNVLCEKDG